MALCKTCGVDIGDAVICPLCHKPINSSEAPEQHVSGPKQHHVPLSTEKRLQIFEVISVSLLIAAAAVSIINLVIEGKLSWAWYPLFSLVLIWILAITPFIFPKKPWLVALVDVIGVSVFLYTLDELTGPSIWFFSLALPMIVGLSVAIVIVLLAYTLAKRKGLNIIGWILLAIAEFCIAIETAILMYTHSPFRLFWSSIVASSLIPVALFLFYIHYRIAKSVTLRKLFHL